MKILALDSCTEFCSAALLRDGEVVERVEHAGQRHSELLIGMIRAVLAEGNVRLRELDAIATTVGPGMFTGIRIATAVAQGLAFGAQVPVASIGTLEALANACPAERIVVATDARMGEIYCAAFARNGDTLTTTWGPFLAKPESVPALTALNYVGVGNGFARYRDALAQSWNSNVVQVIDDAFPSARQVALLAAQRVVSGDIGSAATLIPVYVRDKVALTLAER